MPRRLFKLSRKKNSRFSAKSFLLPTLILSLTSFDLALRSQTRLTATTRAATCASAGSWEPKGRAEGKGERESGRERRKGKRKGKRKEKTKGKAEGNLELEGFFSPPRWPSHGAIIPFFFCCRLLRLIPTMRASLWVFLALATLSVCVSVADAVAPFSEANTTV